MRFRAQTQPLSAIAEYLTAVHTEALSRGYNFDKSKIGQILTPTPMQVTLGQMEYETQHLLAKLAVRSPLLYQQYYLITMFEAHPMFTVRAGEVGEKVERCYWYLLAVHWVCSLEKAFSASFTNAEGCSISFTLLKRLLIIPTS